MSDTTSEEENKEQSQHPNYFALLTLTALDDPSLPDGAKLLLARITSLANKQGRAWAQNAYFAEKHNTSERTIGTWIQRLREEGYIKVFYEYYPNSKKVKRRYIYPVIDPAAKRKEDAPDLVVKFTSPPDDLVVKNSSPPSGEVNFRENNISFNNIKAAAADHNDQNFEEPEKPPEKAAAEPFEEQEVKNIEAHFKHLNPKLCFDKGFYPKVLTFLFSHELGLGFVSWMYEFCLKKKPRELSAYLYTIFFEERYVALYREAAKPPPVVMIRCPVCDTEHNSADAACPACGFETVKTNDKNEIFRQRRLYAMAPEVRKTYEAEMSAIIRNKETDFSKKGQELDSLRRKYGLQSDG